MTRARVLALAGELGLPVVEEAFDRALLYAASEVFLCSTTSFAAVGEIDGRAGDGVVPGPWTLKLYAAYRAEVIAQTRGVGMGESSEMSAKS